MELVSKRIAKKKDYTIGHLFVKEDVLYEYSTGENKTVGHVWNSNTWIHRLKQKIVEAKDCGEGVWITIK